MLLPVYFELSGLILLFNLMIIRMPTNEEKTQQTLHLIRKSDPPHIYPSTHAQWRKTFRKIDVIFTCGTEISGSHSPSTDFWPTPAVDGFIFSSRLAISVELGLEFYSDWVDIWKVVVSALLSIRERRAMANIQIQPAEHRVSQQHQEVDNGSNNQLLPKYLYVGDLEPNVIAAQMCDLFGRIGPVLTVHICGDAITNISLGYVYVHYSSAENASEALSFLNYTPLNANPIWIMYSPHDSSMRTFVRAKIFVKNLDQQLCIR